MSLQSFINNIPKAELHLHIEGTFEPELLFSIAQRNNIALPYPTISSLKEAYNFSELQDFLDIYYKGAEVLQTEEDFYDLTYAYLKRLNEQNVVHAEIMFDPQTHTSRGIPFASVVNGIWEALQDAQRNWGLSSFLILSFLRHLSEEDAFETLKEALPYKDRFKAVGLDSSENGHPPKKFERVYKMALEEGFIGVAHAGEEGPASNIKDSLERLGVSRIDHGNSCLDDATLVRTLRQKQIPLTLCPLSNLALKVISKLEDHPLREMMNQGLLVTINSDDPAYFGGGLNDNYLAISQALNLTKEDITQLAINSFKGSFLDDDEKAHYIQKIEQHSQSYATKTL